MQDRGFTLIETLVYLALYSIIILGALAASYSIFESSARNETITLVEEEGNYLIAKIDLALAHAASIELPSANGNTLLLKSFDGSEVRISNNSSRLTQQIDTKTVDTLSNSNVSVVGLMFEHTSSSADGFEPESVSTSFTLMSTTSEGHVLSREFSSMRFLHS